jgi:hypothetical protein
MINVDKMMHRTEGKRHKSDRIENDSGESTGWFKSGKKFGCCACGLRSKRGD